MKDWLKIFGARTTAPTEEDFHAEPVGGNSDDLAARLIAAHDGHRLIETDYPYTPRERPFPDSAGGRRMVAMLKQAEESASRWLAEAALYSDQFRKIPRHADAAGTTPSWINGMFPGLDGMILYTLVRTLRPRVYLEIGSGNSTKFVRRAIDDGALATRIVSIDPNPRAEIDLLCDEVIRLPFEEVPERRYAGLVSPGDIIFIDNSHRSFTNSDVTVFFTELLPSIPAGVYYGIHDIFLPFDYPEEWKHRFYNEQYLLTSYLLGGGDGDEIVFPGFHVWSTRHFSTAVDGLFDHPEFRGADRHAGAFWMRRQPGRKP